MQECQKKDYLRDKLFRLVNGNYSKKSIILIQKGINISGVNQKMSYLKGISWDLSMQHL